VFFAGFFPQKIGGKKNYPSQKPKRAALIMVPMKVTGSKAKNM